MGSPALQVNGPAMAEGYQRQRPEISPASTYLIKPIAIERDELSSLPEEVMNTMSTMQLRPQLAVATACAVDSVQSRLINSGIRITRGEDRQDHTGVIV